MPASIPGSTLAQNQANPSAGAGVIFDLMSGPKGSPKDSDQSGNCSTGGLATGIGFGPTLILAPSQLGVVANFHDDYTPGVTKPDGTAAAVSTLMYIGGGRSNIVGGVSTPVPYATGFGIGAAGNGGSRDAGAGPAYTGFGMKIVTTAADVAAAGVIETGYVNRTGGVLVSGASTLGSSTTASGAPTMEGEADPPAEAPTPPPEEPPAEAPPPVEPLAEPPATP